MKNLTHREKVLWINLLTVAILFSYYFVTIAIDEVSGGEAVWRFLKTTFWAIVIEVIAISILSAFEKPQAADERDRAIEAKAFKWGYYTLFVGLAFTLWQTGFDALTQSLAAHPEASEKLTAILERHSEAAGPFMIIHVLLVTITLAELVKVGTQLILYRRGF